MMSPPEWRWQRFLIRLNLWSKRSQENHLSRGPSSEFKMRWDWKCGKKEVMKSEGKKSQHTKCNMIKVFPTYLRSKAFLWKKNESVWFTFACLNSSSTLDFFNCQFRSKLIPFIAVNGNDWREEKKAPGMHMIYLINITHFQAIYDGIAMLRLSHIL